MNSVPMYRNCSKCGEIFEAPSDEAEKPCPCPSCGFVVRSEEPEPEPTKTESRATWILIGIASLVGFVIVLFVLWQENQFEQKLDLEGERAAQSPRGEVRETKHKVLIEIEAGEKEIEAIRKRFAPSKSVR